MFCPLAKKIFNSSKTEFMAEKLLIFYKHGPKIPMKVSKY